MKFYCWCCYFTCRDDHPHLLITSMASIITSILEENVETDPDPSERSSFQSLLDVILQNLLKVRKVVLKFPDLVASIC